MTSPAHIHCNCAFCSAMRSGHLSPAMGVPVVDDGEVTRLRAEVERLRAALQSALNLIRGGPSDDLEWAARIAHAALGEAKGRP